ncbi:MAG TPA: GMC family oxidoreductase N-terminal domain-containing protein [Baekduia sp.]
MYDFIVVGTGAGGAVLAGRLSEDPDVRVLVVEAGEADTAPEIEMPAAAGALMRGRYDWDFSSETEWELDERVVPVPRGRVVGGTTVLNGTIYTRGQRRDYDTWAAEHGATGWSSDEVLPYFKLAEDYEHGADDYHGAGGPLTVAHSRSRHPLCAAFVEGAVQAGVPRNDDFSGAVQEGAGWFQLMQRDGRRLSAAKAYLHPALGRPNLTLLTSTHVTRILFDGRRATGVETWRDGAVERHHAGEVLVCAGAIQSPQLLMLSGLGPAEHLRSFGIDVLEDLPVGQNLMDHNNLTVVAKTDEESLISAFTPENVALYEREGRGPLTSNAAEAGAFLRVKPGEEEPDFELHGINVGYRGPNIITEHGISIAGYPTYAASRGTVTLRTTDPFSKPRIQHNYLTAEEDVVTLRAGIRRIFEIFEAPAIASIVTGFYDRPADDSDAAVDAFVRRRAECGNHHAATCGMGAVLDERLRVRGVEGLRVMDASSMPTLVRGNPTGVIIAMAEKASDLIRGIDRTSAPAATAAGA